MNSKNKPLSRKDNIVVQELDGEVLIYDLTANKAFCLNETSALIWHACDGSKDVTELNTFLAGRLNSPVNEDLVWLALDQLKKEKLIENAPDTAARFAGMSRRDVIRKVGVGALVAIPIVAGLVAPPAYAQGSGCGNTCTCNDAGPYAAGAVCATSGAGTMCGNTPTGCTVCRAVGAIVSGMTGAGFCSMT